MSPFALLPPVPVRIDGNDQLLAYDDDHDGSSPCCEAVRCQQYNDPHPSGSANHHSQTEDINDNTSSELSKARIAFKEFYTTEKHAEHHPAIILIVSVLILDPRRHDHCSGDKSFFRALLPAARWIGKCYSVPHNMIFIASNRRILFLFFVVVAGHCAASSLRRSGTILVVERCISRTISPLRLVPLAV